MLKKVSFSRFESKFAATCLSLMFSPSTAAKIFILWRKGTDRCAELNIPS